VRDARPFLQIAHVGPWNVAVPEALSRARSRAFRGERSTSRSVAIARHDPTAALALRQWLEAIALRDPVGRKLPTWLVETGARTALGDDSSFAHARTLARSLAHGAQQGRVLVAGTRDTQCAFEARPWDERMLEARFGLSHPSAPLVLRAPHGAFEVQLVAEDTERVPREHARERTASVLAEYAPTDQVPVLLLGAGHQHDQVVDRLGAELRWVFSSLGSAESVRGSAAFLCDYEDGPGPCEQRAALVRVYASPSQRRAAIIERLMFARPLAMGPFRLVPSQTLERLISWP
jgi:hypothetical protein